MLPQGFANSDRHGMGAHHPLIEEPGDMLSPTRVLLTASAVLAIGILPLSNVAGATATTLTGSLAPLGSAQAAVPADPGQISVDVSCTGKARITATLVDPSGTSLASQGMACPRGGTVS